MSPMLKQRFRRDDQTPKLGIKNNLKQQDKRVQFSDTTQTIDSKKSLDTNTKSESESTKDTDKTLVEPGPEQTENNNTLVFNESLKVRQTTNTAITVETNFKYAFPIPYFIDSKLDKHYFDDSKICLPEYIQVCDYALYKKVTTSLNPKFHTINLSSLKTIKEPKFSIDYSNQKLIDYLKFQIIVAMQSQSLEEITGVTTSNIIAKFKSIVQKNIDLDSNQQFKTFMTTPQIINKPSLDDIKKLLSFQLFDIEAKTQTNTSQLFVVHNEEINKLGIKNLAFNMDYNIDIIQHCDFKIHGFFRNKFTLDIASQDLKEIPCLPNTVDKPRVISIVNTIQNLIKEAKQTPESSNWDIQQVQLHKFTVPDLLYFLSISEPFRQGTLLHEYAKLVLRIIIRSINMYSIDISKLKDDECYRLGNTYYGKFNDIPKSNYNDFICKHQQDPCIQDLCINKLNVTMKIVYDIPESVIWKGLETKSRDRDSVDIDLDTKKKSRQEKDIDLTSNKRQRDINASLSADERQRSDIGISVLERNREKKTLFDYSERPELRQRIDINVDKSSLQTESMPSKLNIDVKPFEYNTTKLTQDIQQVSTPIQKIDDNIDAIDLSKTQKINDNVDIGKTELNKINIDVKQMPFNVQSIDQSVAKPNVQLPKYQSIPKLVDSKSTVKPVLENNITQTTKPISSSNIKTSEKTLVDNDATPSIKPMISNLETQTSIIKPSSSINTVSTQPTPIVKQDLTIRKAPKLIDLQGSDDESMTSDKSLTMSTTADLHTTVKPSSQHLDKIMSSQSSEMLQSKDSTIELDTSLVTQDKTMSKNKLNSSAVSVTKISEMTRLSFTYFVPVEHRIKQMKEALKQLN